MTKPDLEKILSRHPFVAGLSAEHLRLLADCAMQTHFEAGQIVFREGDTANRFYLIEQGEVALESPEPGALAIIDVLKDGELLGWSWLFPPFTWQFTARATQPTTAIFFYGTVLREHCEADPALGYEIFKRMSEVMTRRLQHARSRLLDAHDIAAPPRPDDSGAAK